jgi:hypothetical protein
MIKNPYIDCLDLTSVWRRWRRRRPACIVERRQWRRRRLACTHGRAAVAAEEAIARAVEQWRQRSRPTRAASTVVKETNGVESEWWGLREFWDKKQNGTKWASFYRFKTISNSL